MAQRGPIPQKFVFLEDTCPLCEREGLDKSRVVGVVTVPTHIAHRVLVDTSRGPGKDLGGGCAVVNQP